MSAIRRNTAPAERSGDKELQHQIKLFKENEELKELANAVSVILVVLNKNRQIIYANKMFVSLLNLTESASILGKRVGEAVSCSSSGLVSSGCGASEFCQTCNAIEAIFESQLGVQSISECQIITQNNDALDWRVTATPYTPNGEMFTIFAIHDISHEKRRKILEKIFFHDVLNSAGGISGLSNYLQLSANTDEIREISQMIKRSADNLIEEIQAQQQLYAAENNDYILNLQVSNSLKILNELRDSYCNHEISGDKTIVISDQADDIDLVTDGVLLKRILGNMIKNALEASVPDGVVIINSSSGSGTITFTVHNSTYIERRLQLQLFKRSFSTKGAGRGIGTYSMKLFGEKYLKGRVWFKSLPETGTTFGIEIPTSFK